MFKTDVVTYTPERKLPWIEKYRPTSLNNIISHSDIIMSLKRFIDKKSLPHVLFFGPSGTGKTSTIKCCAYEIYGKYMECMILELNASNERGIDTVRNKIKRFVSNYNNVFLPMDQRNIFKMVILDEIDSMTIEAQGVLRQTIEQFTTTTRFCLICNDIDKINLALQSRCALYRFAPLQTNFMEKKLAEISKLENVSCNKNIIQIIVKLSKGDMRSAINSLQHISLTVGGKITLDDVYNIIGYCKPQTIAEIFGFLTQISRGEITLVESVDKINEIVIYNNITIFNLLEELKNVVILEKNYTTAQKLFLIDNFAKNEVYESVNIGQKNIIMIIASMFVICQTK